MNAKHLWGKWSVETESLVKNEVGHKDAAVIGQGPGAEKLVKYAAVTHTGHRAAGRMENPYDLSAEKMNPDCT